MSLRDLDSNLADRSVVAVTDADDTLAQVIEVFSVDGDAVEQQAPLFHGFGLGGADDPGTAMVAGAESELALEAGIKGEVNLA